jgi:hypothetical protein
MKSTTEIKNAKAPLTTTEIIKYLNASPFYGVTTNASYHNLNKCVACVIFFL